MKPNYIIIHGSFSSPFNNWFGWLYHELSKEDIEVIAPQFPTGDKQNYTNWSKLLNHYKDLGLINDNTIFIGHSVAPIFIIKYLIENEIKVKKLVFVSGFNYAKVNPQYDTVNESFFTDDVEKIHDFCDDIICFYSNNDPYIKYEDLKAFSNKVASIDYEIKDGGHLNSEFGYDKFEKILKYL